MRKYLHRHLTKGDTQMANKYMKRGSPSFLIRKFQIKDTIRYHYTSISMAKIQKTDYSKY